MSVESPFSTSQGEISVITLIPLTLIAQMDFFISLHNLRINTAASPHPGNKHQRKGDFPVKDFPGHSNSASRQSDETAEKKIVVKTSQKHITIFLKSILCPFMAHLGVSHLAAAFPTHSSMQCSGGFWVDTSR